MTAADRNFLEAYEYGNEAEADVSTMLERRGWFVLPTFRFCGRDGGEAPMFRGKDGKFIVIPDLLVSKDGESRWVEVKRKKHAICFRNLREWRHGLSDDRKSRKLSHYNMTERQTGIPVWICIVEDEISYDPPCQCLDPDKDEFGYVARLAANLSALAKTENKREGISIAKGEPLFLRDAFSRLEDCF